MFKEKKLINESDLKIFNVIADNLKEDYSVIYSVRLSEFLSSTSPVGTDDFFNDFEKVNSVTCDFILVDRRIGKVMLVIFTTTSPPDLLDGVSYFEVIKIEKVADTLTNVTLSKYFIE